MKWVEEWTPEFCFRYLYELRVHDGLIFGLETEWESETHDEWTLFFDNEWKVKIAEFKADTPEYAIRIANRHIAKLARELLEVCGEAA